MQILKNDASHKLEAGTVSVTLMTSTRTSQKVFLNMKLKTEPLL